MIAAEVFHSELNRRYQSALSAPIGMLLRSWVTGVIFLTCFFLLMDNHLVFAESDDALFIDQNGNVGIGRQAPRAELDVNGTILGIGMVPTGGIVMFSGDINQAFDAEGTGRKDTPYEGWQLCNGKNGTPDLQDRFVAAAGRNYKIGDQGGSDAVTLTAAQLPVHNHTGTTAASGAHQHWIEGTNANGLAKRRRTYPGQTTVDMGYGGGRNADPGNAQWRGRVNTDTTGSHAHNFSTAAAGGGQPHENRPVFFALAFIMRLPATNGQ